MGFFFFVEKSFIDFFKGMLTAVCSKVVLKAIKLVVVELDGGILLHWIKNGLIA